MTGPMPEITPEQRAAWVEMIGRKIREAPLRRYSTRNVIDPDIPLSEKEIYSAEDVLDALISAGWSLTADAYRAGAEAGIEAAAKECAAAYHRVSPSALAKRIRLITVPQPGEGGNA